MRRRVSGRERSSAPFHFNIFNSETPPPRPPPDRGVPGMERVRFEYPPRMSNHLATCEAKKR